MKKQRVIGVFDSGVGGLTVIKEILAKIPYVRIVYFGDTARAPYGSRSKEELIEFGTQSISFLISQGAEIIVAACNTSSANALPVLRQRFDLPIIGTIDSGASLAVKMTVNGRIGLIATERTVNSNAFNLAVAKALARGVMPENRETLKAWKKGERPISLVKAQACPLFVPLVEAGLAGSAEAEGIARTYLSCLKEAEVDTIILGCTHYPYLNPVITKIMGQDVKLADPAVEMVKEIELALEELERVSGGNGNSNGEVPWKVRYFVSGDLELFCNVGNTLMAEPIDPKDVFHKDLSKEWV